MRTEPYVRTLELLLEYREAVPGSRGEEDLGQLAMKTIRHGFYDPQIFLLAEKVDVPIQEGDSVDVILENLLKKTKNEGFVEALEQWAAAGEAEKAKPGAVSVDGPQAKERRKVDELPEEPDNKKKKEEEQLQPAVVVPVSVEAGLAEFEEALEYVRQQEEQEWLHNCADHNWLLDNVVLQPLLPEPQQNENEQEEQLMNDSTAEDQEMLKKDLFISLLQDIDLDAMLEEQDRVAEDLELLVPEVPISDFEPQLVWLGG